MRNSRKTPSFYNYGCLCLVLMLNCGISAQGTGSLRPGVKNNPNDNKNNFGTRFTFSGFSSFGQNPPSVKDSPPPVPETHPSLIPQYDAFTTAFPTTGRPFVTTRRPFVSTRQPFVSTRRTFVSTRRPFVSTSRPFVSTSRPFVSTTPFDERSQSIIFNVWEYARVVGHQKPLTVIRPRSPALSGGISACSSAIIGCCSTEDINRRESCFEAYGCSGRWIDTEPCGAEMMNLVLQSLIA